MSEYRSSLKQFINDHPVVAQHISQLDCHIVAFLLGRKLARNYQSMGAIVHDCICRVSQLVGSQIPSMFADEASATLDWPDKSKPSSSSTSSIAMVMYDEQSNVINLPDLLATKGFVVDTHVKNKAGLEAVITSITTTTVNLKTDTECVSAPGSEFMSSMWTIVKQKALPHEIDLERFSFSMSREFKIHVMKAKILLELNTLSEKHNGCNNGLQVFSKPNSVKTTKSYKTGSLVLVPTTMKIMHKLGEKVSLPSSALPVHTDLDDVHFWLAAPAAISASNPEGLAAPSWFLEVCQDADGANLAMSHVKVDSVQIPVYKNIKAVGIGESLLAIQPSALNQAPKAKSEPAKKKAKKN